MDIHEKIYSLQLLFIIVLIGVCTANIAEVDWSILKGALSTNASVHTISLRTEVNNTNWTTYEDTYEVKCETLGTNAYAISAASFGLCMHSHECAHEFCQDENKYSLPSHTVDVRNEDDVSNVLQFVNDYNVTSYKTISIKTSGHSYQGSSTVKDSLLIWMYHFEKDGAITNGYENSCGDTHDVVGIGGGETWDDVLEAVKGDYHVVTGGGRTVSAAGGWLLGGGLSFTSRKYGIGVDNVIDFRLALANGTIVTIDACKNEDLFWALRGGGGGSLGVVTHVHYKVHPVTPIVALNFGIYGLDQLTDEDYGPSYNIVAQWLQYWFENSPTLDPNWCGGYFAHTYVHLLYCGTRAQANLSFLGQFQFWYYFVLDKSGTKPGVWDTYFFVQSYDNWYEYKGGAAAAKNPNMTDQTGDAYNGVNEMFARLMPLDIVMSKPDEVLNLFFSTINTSATTLNYFLGGNINNDNNETSVHPSLRNSIYSIFTFGATDSEKVRRFIPNNVTGVCYNHHNVLEPDWKNACWGDNYNTLNAIKDKYDPNHIFNCWHCIGFEQRETASSSAPSASLTMTNMVPSSAPSTTPLVENQYARFLLKFAPNSEQEGGVPVTRTCKWLSNKPTKAQRRVCSSRRHQLYFPKNNLSPASQVCRATCEPYCVIEIQNAKFLLNTNVNEDGVVVEVTRQCKWLKKQTSSKIDTICNAFVNIESMYGQASQVCTEICGSCRS